MNKFIYLLAICFVAVAAASCSDDDDKAYIEGGDTETMAYLKDGMAVGPGEADIIITLRHSPGNLTASCSEPWAAVHMLQSGAQGNSTSFVVSFDPNLGWNSRRAELTLSVGDVSRSSVIIQRPQERMEIDESETFATNEGGDFGVKMKCNAPGRLDVKLNFGAEKPWLTYEGISVDHLNPANIECYIVFKASPNDGLGRICGVTVSSEGTPATVKFCIIQQPRAFGEDETIAIDHSGSLDVLLGNDTPNLRKIRRLTLTGEMNSMDWSALRRLFYKGAAADPKPEQYPVSLDLGRVISVHGGSSYYRNLGYEPEKPKCTVWRDNEIPENVFELCSNLAGIVLPETTVVIGANALSQNNLLTEVDIPDNVQLIETGAFKGCRNLTRINISDNSKLKQLGSYAFMCGRIEMLNLPASLTNIEGGYLNCAVKEMRVHWATPPSLRVPPTVKEDSKLYVPEGSAAAYREAFGWNRFPEIVEY